VGAQVSNDGGREMGDGPPRASLNVGTIAALSALAWCLIGLGYASLAPSQSIPRIFHNYHIEHFAAFYIVALLSSAALPRTRLTWIALSLAALATVFAGFRLIALVRKLFYAEDLLCDYAGILAALAPIAVGRFRQFHQLAPD
jgi:hypothetical protein